MGPIQNIAVIGAGMMGPGIAQVFAFGGHSVVLYARRPEALGQAIERVRANLKAMAEHEIIAPEEIEPAISRIKTTSDLNEATASAHFVIESIAEDLALKQDFFKRLDSLCPPETILATNTSVMSITEIAQKSARQERILGTHFWNPPHLLPLVEVVPGEKTATKAMDLTMDLLKAAGKHPVRVNKDVPGFVANRLQHALWREAISIVERGIAEPAVVDEVIQYSFGIRLPVLGPITNADMGGLDLTLAIHSYVLKHLEASPEPSPLLKEKVAKGELGFKTGRGFQDWTPEAMARVRQNLMEHLLKWTKEQKALKRP